MYDFKAIAGYSRPSSKDWVKALAAWRTGRHAANPAEALLLVKQLDEAEARVKDRDEAFSKAVADAVDSGILATALDRERAAAVARAEEAEAKIAKALTVLDEYKARGLQSPHHAVGDTEALFLDMEASIGCSKAHCRTNSRRVNHSFCLKCKCDRA